MYDEWFQSCFLLGLCPVVLVVTYAAARHSLSRRVVADIRRWRAEAEAMRQERDAARQTAAELSAKNLALLAACRSMMATRVGIYHADNFESLHAWLRPSEQGGPTVSDWGRLAALVLPEQQRGAP